MPTKKRNYLIDMDGVLVHGKNPVPGAPEFIQRLKNRKCKFLILTNNSIYTPGDLSHRLKTNGLEIEEDQIFTSGLATALFLDKQRPRGTAYVIGESGLTTLLHNIGYIISDSTPDYVVVGETHQYNFEQVKKAVRLILGGARFILTNHDPSSPGESGIVPGAGALAALIEKASGAAPFIIGKPNPLMMRSALNFLDVHSEDTTMIGDRMETDIAAGVMSGLETILVLSGVMREEDILRFPYHPTHVYPSVAEIEP